VRVGGLLALLAGATLLATLLVRGRPQEPLPVIAVLPDFTLTEASGRAVSRADLLGAPWVADLIFTSCGGVCPAMTGEMKRLQGQTAGSPSLRLVSITVDPETDTPSRLTEYAARFEADRSRWLFLTGDTAAIRKLATEGLLLPVMDGDRERGDDAFVHSPRFVLVDGQARVRGTYDSRDPEAMLRLRGDVHGLLAEEGAAGS
jgi:protein SCO1